MQIFKIIVIALCVLFGGMVFYYYFKTRKILNENSDVELDKIMPNIQAMMKMLSFSIYGLVGIFAIYVIIGIVEYFIK